MFSWRRSVVMAVLATAAAWITAVSAAHAEDRWVQSHVPTDLYAGADADAPSFGRVRQFSYFRLHSSQMGERFYVYNPRSQNFAYVNAKDVGPSAAPPAEYFSRPRVIETLDVPGRALGTVSVWREPATNDEVWSHEIYHNSPLAVKQRVEGEDGEEWFRLDDGAFVHADQVRLPPSVDQLREGRWIDVTLSDPAMVVAYEDGRPVRSTLAIHGIGGWETPIGTYVLQRRVANEIMQGPGWYVSGVLFTQYFTGAGHSIHYNYWSSNWGYQGSHGCLGLSYDDSLWFWEWATVGTPIDIHW